MTPIIPSESRSTGRPLITYLHIHVIDFPSRFPLLTLLPRIRPFFLILHHMKMCALYEFSDNTIEVGRLNLIEGDYEPDLDKEYVVWWQNNGKRTAWTAKVLATGGKLSLSACNLTHC